MLTLAQQRRTVLTCFLGWTIDAFDFFIMIFVVTDIAKEFGVTITDITWAITLTLGLRVLGAAAFGRLADRYGRRPALIINVVTFTAFQVLTGFSPSLTIFLVLRSLYGIAMGGEWGIGASLAMESIPERWRGLVSGVLQSGYSFGYLLAAVLYGVGYEYLGWRGMFMVAAVPSLLLLVLIMGVQESPVWKEQQKVKQPGMLEVMRGRWKLVLYAVVLMFAAATFSHGTQDLYPVFLKLHHGLSVHQVATIAIVYNIGAILGCLCGGTLSQKIGRRRELMLAAAAVVMILPFWAQSTGMVWIAVLAFAMQFLVQCTFGVMPAHLNEISPASMRGTFPGFTYQCGNMLAAGNATIQAVLADRLGNFPLGLSLVVAAGAVVFFVFVAARPDAHGRALTAEDAAGNAARSAEAD